MYVCIKYYYDIYFYFFLDDNINSYKLTTISNKNLYEPTTSNNTMIEWLDENNITDESMHEDDVLNVNIKIYRIIY